MGFAYVFWRLVIFWATQFLPGASSRLAPSPCGWDQISAGLGPIQIDGTFGARHDLADDLTLKAFGFQVVLHPEVQTDSRGVPFSAWRVHGLQSTLLPHGNLLIWRSPGRELVRFKRDRLAPHFVEAGAKVGWIKAHGADEYSVADDGGRVWFFRRGALTSVAHPQLGRLLVKSRGANIEQIVIEATGEVLLTARYDPAGRLAELATRGATSASLTWSEGRLVAVTRRSAPPLAFGYKDRLLHHVREGDDTKIVVRWERHHPGAGMPAPVWMAGFGEERFDVHKGREGFVIRRYDQQSRMLTRTAINPRTQVILQQDFLAERCWRFDLRK